MSVNSLSNFGVPGLNGDRSAVLQPVLSNRFRVLFYNFGTTGDPAPYDLTRQVQRVGRPGLTFDTITLYQYVSTVYIAGRGEWGELSVSFMDDITNSVMRRVQNQNFKQQNFFDQTVARAGENYKFEMDLDILAGGASAGGSASDPNIIQKWCFSGCHIVSQDLGEMNYTEVNPMEITLTVRFDNVIGFDQNGAQFGADSPIAQNISSQTGFLSTGAGSSNSSVSIGGGSVSLNTNGVNIGF